MANNVDDFKKNHVNNYRMALIETVNNNTNALFDEDISSLLKIPPLDSMDLIKVKFLDLAKKNKIVLNTSELTDMLNKYHGECLKICDSLKKTRIDFLSSKVKNYSLESDTDTIKLLKKDFTDINKKVKSDFKEHIKNVLNNNVFSVIDVVFADDVPLNIKKKIIADITKYVNGNYLKQLLENIDFKILVKDTILINSFKEQSDRYLFTLENSRLFDVD